MPMVTPYKTPLPARSTEVFRNNIFDGKVILCTGGGSGICRNGGISKAMTEAVMRHGAEAFIIGRKLDRLKASATELSKLTGKRCGYGSADVRDKAQLKQAVDKCIHEFGHINFVICGAAGNFLATIDGVSENAFKTVIDIDTIGTYNTVKATINHVREAKGSYIMVSATLQYRGNPYQVHASAAKAGVDALSRVLAAEEGPRGVRSNVIAPGPIADTEGFDRLSSGAEGDDVAGVVTALQRFGSKADVANMTVFLFSEAANFITGQAIAVDGGEMHMTNGFVPNYPDSVLDPASMAGLIKGKL